MFRSKVRVTLRRSILDPQGKAVEHAISSLGFNGVSDVRVGKLIEFQVDRPSEVDARRTAEEICRKLLANLVMEDYSVDIEKIDHV